MHFKPKKQAYDSWTTTRNPITYNDIKLNEFHSLSIKLFNQLWWDGWYKSLVIPIVLDIAEGHPANLIISSRERALGTEDCINAIIYILRCRRGLGRQSGHDPPVLLSKWQGQFCRGNGGLGTLYKVCYSRSQQQYDLNIHFTFRRILKSVLIDQNNLESIS